MGLHRRRALCISAVALFATSAAACSAVLGLDPPSLAACADGCPDTGGLPPVTEDSGGSSGGDTAPASGSDAAPEAAPFDATGPIDAPPDVVPDRGPSSGVRCGPVGSSIFCADPSPLCCLTVDDSGSATYACTTGTSDCTGYPIACASDDDCNGSEVCCFYKTGIECKPEDTSSCDNVLVCDPSAPASESQCNTGQTCSVAWISDAGTLPYFGCN